MRYLTHKQIDRNRRRRRLAAAILLSATLPNTSKPGVVAADPHPFPVQASQLTVRTNPFCPPETEYQGDHIQLASGKRRFTVKLEPIGKAVGLRTLPSEPDPTVRNEDLRNENLRNSDVRNGDVRNGDVRNGGLTIEPPQSNIQHNPLIRSTHHPHAPLVTAPVAGDPPAAGGRSVARPSGTTLILKPPRPVRQAEQPTAAPHAVAEPGAAEPDLSELNLSELHLNELHLNEPGMPELDPARPVLSDPVLGDAAMAEAAGPNTANSSDAAPTVASQAAPEPIRFSFSDTSPPPSATAPPTASPTAPATSRPTLPPVVPEDDSAVILTPSPQPPVLALPRQVDRSESTAVKRYRPPVAVTVVPLAIERDGHAADAATPVHAASPFDPAGVPLAEKPAALPDAAHEDGHATALKMNLAEVRSLILGGTLRGVEVADAAICRAIATGPSEVKLIGTSPGVTRLVVWAGGEDETRPSQSRVFEVHVGDQQQNRERSLTEAAELLNRSLAQAFPDCPVTVRASHSGLTVSGRCHSEAAAKKIMRLVRKTCLVPVNDELIVD